MIQPYDYFCWFKCYYLSFCSSHISLDRCNRSFNTVYDSSAKIWLPDKTKDLNAKYAILGQEQMNE